MSDEDIFDIDDNEDVDLNPINKAPSNRVDRLKGVKDETYRIGLMYFHTIEKTVVLAAKRKAKKEGSELDKDAVRAAVQKALEKRAGELEKSVDELTEWDKLETRKAQFKSYKSHYKEGVGVVQSRLGKDGADADKYWGMMGDASQYYTAVAIVYATDREGNVDKEGLLSRSYVKPLRLSARSFNRLIEVDQKLRGLPGGTANLSNMDLLFKCTNSDWQNWEIDFASESLWQKSKKLRGKFLPQAYNIYDKIVDAREMSTADLKIKLGIGGDSGEDVSDDEMDDLLEDV